jgi:hypothetical protein
MGCLTDHTKARFAAAGVFETTFQRVRDIRNVIDKRLLSFLLPNSDLLRLSRFAASTNVGRGNAKQFRASE